MGNGFEIDVNFDEGDLEDAVREHAREAFREHIETELQDGAVECDCGSTLFDIETYTDGSGEVKAAGVCRECNTPVDIEVDQDGL